MHNYTIIYKTVFSIFLHCFFITNQVTNVLSEVVPFCKFGHIFILCNGFEIMLIKTSNIIHIMSSKLQS